MKEDFTRQFKASYQGSDGKKHSAKVRVFKRLVVFGLSLVMTHNLTACSLVPENELGDGKNNTSSEQLLEESDIELIERIIRENPHMLKDVSTDTYVVKAGDSLSSIAEDCGNTIKRIRELNGIKDSKQIIRIGEELKTETITDKPELDRDIIILESWFHDYVLNSKIGKMAKSYDPNSKEVPKDASLYIKNIIYGYPKSEAEIDPNSLFGRYVNAYIGFHENEKPDEETKNEYLSTLKDIAKETEKDLSFGGDEPAVVSSRLYGIYLRNGNTKDDTIQEGYHSIYN